jgi:hypothetical protein
MLTLLCAGGLALAGCHSGRPVKSEAVGKPAPAATAAKKPAAPASAAEAAPAVKGAVTSCCTMDLDKAVKGNKALTILMGVAGNKCKYAYGLTPKYNCAVHDVDAADLKISESAVKGTLKVVVNPDNWVPPDKKPVAAEYALDAQIAGGKITGAYQGKFGAVEAGGTLAGKSEAVKPLTSGEVAVKMENALTGGPGHLTRVELNLTFADGKATKARVVGMDPRQWTCNVTSQDVQVTPEGVTGTVAANVQSGMGSVLTGTYTFTLDARRVGPTVAGNFKAKLGDRDLSGGTLRGAIK